MTPTPGKRRRGNPNFVKGHPGGPGRKLGSRNVVVKIPRCAEFMETRGWKILEEIAERGSERNRVASLQLIAAYGYGRPSESVDITSSGKSITMSDFLSSDRSSGGSGDGADNIES